MARYRVVARRTDWFRVLADLQYVAKIPNADVALRVNVAPSTVRGWKSGSEPRYDDGERLLSLWSILMGKPIDARPRLTG
jgi:hypothetical protein